MAQSWLMKCGSKMLKKVFGEWVVKIDQMGGGVRSTTVLRTVESSGAGVRDFAKNLVPYLTTISPSSLHRHRRMQAISSSFTHTIIFSRGMNSFPHRHFHKQPPDRQPPTFSPYNRKQYKDPELISPPKAAIQEESPPSSSSSSSIDPNYSSTYYFHPFIVIKCYEPYDRAVLPLYGSKQEGNPWIPLSILTALNVIVFLAWQDAMDPENPNRDHAIDFMYNHFTTSIDNMQHGRYHSLLLSAFSHQTLPHMGGNLFALWLFGFTPCRMMSVFYKTGSPGFLALYVVGGIMASLGHLLYLKDTDQTMIVSRKKVEQVMQELEDQDQPRQELLDFIKSIDKPALGASVCCFCLFACLFVFEMDHLELT